VVRLAFAVIAHVDADILVIDEALAVGDAFFTQKCMRFMRDYMNRGTVLFVSHDTSSVRNLCDRAIWFNRGFIIGIGQPKEICEQYLEAVVETHQGAHVKRESQPKIASREPLPRRDQRQELINASNFRNDIEVFHFVSDATSFGKRHIEITDVAFFDLDECPLAWIVGGEDVVLRIQAKAANTLSSVIFGFYIKDRLGQTLFGDNTFLSYVDKSVCCSPGETLIADFRFQMPRLASGDYSVSAAIAEGTQSDHVQHHWIHDALFFRSESTSVASGIIGIPMVDIQIKNLM
jgi:lipopolysaccharide transport system ATP-binding protein